VCGSRRLMVDRVDTRSVDEHDIGVIYGLCLCVVSRRLFLSECHLDIDWANLCRMVELLCRRSEGTISLRRLSIYTIECVHFVVAYLFTVSLLGFDQSLRTRLCNGCRLPTNLLTGSDAAGRRSRRPLVCCRGLLGVSIACLFVGLTALRGSLSLPLVLLIPDTKHGCQRTMQSSVDSICTLECVDHVLIAVVDSTGGMSVRLERRV